MIDHPQKSWAFAVQLPQWTGSSIAMWYHPWSQHNLFIDCNLAFSRAINGMV